MVGAMILALLPACMLPWGNGIRAKGEFPMEFGAVASAVWWEDTDSADDGRGWGALLLTSADVSCGDLESEDFELYEGFWDESGLYAELDWYHSPFDDDEDGANVGFEGT